MMKKRTLSLLGSRLHLRSIRSRMLVAFMLLVLLPTAAVTLCSAIVGFHSGKEQVFNQLESVISLKEAEIRTWMENLRSDLAFAVNDPEVYEWVDDLIRSSSFLGREPEPRGVRADYAYLMLRDHFLRITEIANRPRLRELLLISRDGNVLLSTDAWNEELHFGGQHFFLDGLRRPGVHVEQVPNASAQNKVWALVVVEPLFDESGEVLGVLAGRADLSRLNAIMVERSGLGETGETYLLSPPGILLTESRFRGYARGRARFLDYEHLFGMQQRLGRAMYTDYRDVPVIGVFSRMEDLELLIVAEMDQQEAFYFIFATLKLNILVALAAVLLAGLASVLFTRGLAGRLGHLAATAKAIAGGDLGRSAPVVGETEISDLAAAFNAMTGRLHRRIEVEKMVAELSRELLTVSHQNVQPTLEKVLARVGSYLGADGLSVFQLCKGGRRVERVLEWREEGFAPGGEVLEELPMEQVAWFARTLREKGVVNVPELAELPESAAGERRLWRSLGAKSLLGAPMEPGGRLRGFVVAMAFMGERCWAEDEVALLPLVADIMGSALEREDTLHALQNSEERYALAQRAAKIGSWDWDVASGKLHVSDAFEPILGFSPGSFDGYFRTFLRLLHKQDRPGVVQALRTSCTTGRGFTVEHRVVRKDGVMRWISQSGAVFRNEAGRPQRMLGTVRDITERKHAEDELGAMNRRLELLVEERTRDLEQKASELERANERLMDLDRLKSSFLASVSHELRTPLTSIMGFAKLISKDYAKLLEKGAETPPTRGMTRIQTNLDIILMECGRLSRLINDVLDLSKIESGRLEWRDRKVDVSACIQAAVDAVQVQFAEKPEVTLEVIPGKDLPSMFIDPDRLSQVLINLLHNAVKFTQRGTVRLRAETAGQENLRIRVEDTGEGIEAADIEHIFDKFHQASKYDTLDKPQGTGLGLAICRHIVENYGGRIWAESTRGEGSVFVVELPLRRQLQSGHRAAG